MKITHPFFLGNVPQYYCVLEQDFSFLDELFEQIMESEKQTHVPAWKGWANQLAR